MIYATKTFWADTAVRALKTFAQAAVALLGANAAGILTVDWVNLASVSGLAAVVSVLTSISSADSVGVPKVTDVNTNPGPTPGPEDYVVDTSDADETDAAPPAEDPVATNPGAAA